MKIEMVYESPKSEIVKIITEQMVLAASFYGEGIEEWEDM